MKAEGLHEIFGPSFPSISTVSKELKSLRNNDEARSPESKGLDQPWSLGCLANREYYIPAEALPLVMTAHKKRLAKNDVLPVREALWIGRLYKVIDDLDLLWDWALQYSLSEWVSEITHNPFDTTDLDLELVRNPQSATTSRENLERWGAIMDIAYKYGASLDESLDFVVQFIGSGLTLGKIERIAKSGKFRKEGEK